MGTVANATTPRSLEEQPDKPPKEEMEDPPIMPIGRPRLVLEPTDDDDLPINIPLDNYCPPKGFGKLVTGVVLALVAFEAAQAAYEYRIPLGKRIIALMDGHFSPETSQAAAGYRFGPPPPPPPSVDQGGIAAIQALSTQPSAIAESRSQRTPSIAPQIAEQVPGPNSNVATSRVTPEATQVPPDGIPSVEAANAVKVAPSTMEANLVMSRVPVYPEIAKLDRVEGNVVMEAIISRDGMVKHVHIIQGDSRLRNAATEAVFKRRYRPYIRDGQPVEVATTIAVDFRLPR
jgi:TonB family protein